MAPSTPNTAVADQLVASILPEGTLASKLRKHKDILSRKLRSHSHARTDQFEVAERLDGLQERFQILNNDELADALHMRLGKLKHRSEKWLPDILDLLLRLADDPTSKTRIEWLADARVAPIVVSSLKWAEVEADDPIDRKDQIWRVSEYSDLSSDDDIVEVAPESPEPDTTLAILDEQEAPLREKFEAVDLHSATKALDCLRRDQFWHHASTEPLELSELQVIREILFMLQGLPTALLWKVGNQFEIDQRFRLKNSSREVFLDTLSDFSQMAARLDLLRGLAKKAQPDRFMQTLRSTIQGILHQIDIQLYALEYHILTEDENAPATLLQLLIQVSKVGEVTGSLGNVVAKIESGTLSVVMCLELLFDQVCQTQANGDRQGLECMSNLFSSCFENYFQPLRNWMDYGTLREIQQTMFVNASQLDHDPSRLWQKWYKLAGESAVNRCPGFLQPVKAQIFNIGKTVVFLRRLNVSFRAVEGSPMSLSQESLSTSEMSLLPFSELFLTSMQEFVESRLRIATSVLRDHLGNSCGLWRTLDALSYIYLGTNGYITDMIDAKLFTSIDKCNKSWNDRFLLQDHLQTIFEPIGSVEIDCLVVRSSPRLPRNMAHRRQSVKLLQDLRIQYKLHWSIANVLTTPSISSYQRISTFLTQIRRARYTLERRNLFQIHTNKPDSTRQEQSLNLTLHRNLLLFTNTLYSHLTTLVIEASTSTLHQSLTNAPHIDAMISAHNKYCQTLEAGCLTSKKLKPIHDTIIEILDLCIRFSDLNNPTPSTTTTTRNRSRASSDANSYISATSHQHHRRRRRHNQEEPPSPSSEEDEDEDASPPSTDEQEEGEGEGYSTFTLSLSPSEASTLHHLLQITVAFERNISFLVAGLRGIAGVSVGGEAGAVYWDVLAARLDLAWGGGQ
jgi:gamma-tubulin complex component 5